MEEESLEVGVSFVRFHDVKGDGNCLFRCVSLVTEGTEEKYAEVRRRAVDYVCQHWIDREYGTYVAGTEYPDGVLITSRHQYHDYMSQDTVHGTEIEVDACAQIFQIHVTILFDSAHKPPAEYGNHFESNCDLFYEGDGYNGHYQLVTHNTENQDVPIADCGSTEGAADPPAPLIAGSQRQKKKREPASRTILDVWSEILAKKLHVDNNSRGSASVVDVMANNCNEVEDNATADFEIPKVVAASTRKRKYGCSRRMRRIKLKKVRDAIGRCSVREPEIVHLPVEMDCEDEQTEQHQLIVRKDIESDGEENVFPEGNRIVNVGFLLSQLKNFPHLKALGCGLENLLFVKEIRNGLESTLHFRCNMCNTSGTVECTKRAQDLNLNFAAVSGTVLSGGGHTVLDKILTTLEVPNMSPETYSVHHSLLHDATVQASQREMAEAAEEEKLFAKKHGLVGEDGVPEIPVIVDGSWGKRSFGNRYNSLGGVGVIIGYHTKRVIFIGVKNKYCLICARGKGQAPDHICFKNWDRNKSSTSMEATAIQEGLAMSEEMYGMRYTKVIGDGDSAVHHAIVMTKPYGDVKVEKIECTNHLLRSLVKNLEKIAISSSQYQTGEILLKKVLKDNITRLRQSVVKAIEHRRTAGVNTENAALLREDIMNAPSHIFGEHKNCAVLKYFCSGQKKEKEVDYVGDMQLHGLYSQIMIHVKNLATNSYSLLHKVTTNAVENFNAVIATLIAGKRINYTGRQSYHTRVNAAVLGFNNGKPYSQIYKTTKGKEVGGVAKLAEERRYQRRKLQRKYRNKRKSKFPIRSSGQDKDYGEKANKPDMPWESYVEERQAYVQESSFSEDEIKQIEVETRGQSSSARWRELRKRMITASNFGTVCAMRGTTSTANIVKCIVGNEAIHAKSLSWGVENERNAIEELEKRLNVHIEKRGLMIHSQFPYLAGSPDGFIVETNAVVEVKCPYSAANMTPDEGIAARKITFWKKDGSVNAKHKYFYQVQGQMQMANAKRAIFAVWTPKALKWVEIERNDELWNEVMLPKLQKFFLNCLLPEIVDPRLQRSLPVRPLTIDGLIVEVKDVGETKDDNDVTNNDADE